MSRFIGIGAAKVTPMVGWVGEAKTNSHRLTRLLCAMLALALISAGCSKNPVTGKSELILISRGQEISMGQEAAPEFEKEFGGKVPNQKLQDYVQMVGGSVAQHSDRQMPYEFTLVASNVPNAFALPGGNIFITAGLMRRMTNERQLAAVLAHETGHVAARHNVKGMQRQMGVAVLAELAAAIVGQEKGRAAKAATQVVTSVVTLKYSRDDEYQADQVGLRYMTEAKYNPWGMIELLTVLYNLSESEPGSLGEMFQTHPITSKRIEQAQEIIQGDDRYRRFSADARDPQKARFMRMHKLLIQAVPAGALND